MGKHLTTIKCTWSGCPTHTRVNVTGRGAISLIWAGKFYIFHATDCLALWAGSFPIGYVPSGDDPNEEDE